MHLQLTKSNQLPDPAGGSHDKLWMLTQLVNLTFDGCPANKTHYSNPTVFAITFRLA
ncbi:hypothetical protein D3C81_2082600 [compost metagenome]